jgi:glycosyltransferase involved in cell wall biosynthesis
MKNILIDLYKVKDKYSGLGQFSTNFANELASRPPADLAVEFLVPVTHELPLFGNNIKTIQTSFLKRHFPAINKDYFIWHSLQQFPSFIPRKNTIWVLTIHDLNFMIEKNEAKRNKYLNRLQKNIDRADYITTISNFSKKEIEKNLTLGKKEIHVIHNGINSGEESEKIKPSFINKEKFFFSIGIFNEKKNFKVLLPLIKHFKNHKLIIAGNKEANYGAEVESEIKNLDLENQVILPGKISDENKQWLYANCEAFLFPSLAEGFGMPVIEAMYSGTPVFLSKHTSLPEIGGPLAFYFDNFEVQHMVDLISSKLEYVHQDPELFKEESIKYANTFNWKKCISEYLKLYEHIQNTHDKILYTSNNIEN